MGGWGRGSMPTGHVVGQQGGWGWGAGVAGPAPSAPLSVLLPQPSQAFYSFLPYRVLHLLQLPHQAVSLRQALSNLLLLLLLPPLQPPVLHLPLRVLGGLLLLRRLKMKLDLGAGEGEGGGVMGYE